MKVAILFICTGDYWRFWEGFRQSADKFFMTDCEKSYFVFSDKSRVDFSGADIVVPQDNLGWPLNTLQRFRMFGRIKSELSTFDRLVFLNANCQFLKPISGIEFFGQDTDIVACHHPGFFNKQPEQFTYERRLDSTAHVSDGKVYVAGGLMGGTSTAFIKACEELDQNIESDFDKGLLALWHDESHWNAFINQRASALGLRVHFLNPSYLYPEGWHIPFEPRILLREKSALINVQKIKGTRHGAVTTQTGAALHRRVAKRIWTWLKAKPFTNSTHR
ncbi:hypothetical protein [Limnohabitans sp. 2KL-3]|uniref:hypothetical protein n=1 Tax=Limnohabitans sp. 2KL-3 TaxID=1100700 RepID=UPI000B0B84AB|nr:hypothetical protein [Limnohabitans sp. 2KL-3]